MKAATNLLIFGDNQGAESTCLGEVMRQLGVLGLRIQRPPGAHEEDFSLSRNASYLSVVTPSTHDQSTIRGWWEEEDKARIRKFYQTELDQPGEPPKDCEAWIDRAIVIQHLASPAIWSIFQLQDLLGMDAKLRRRDPHAERIHNPAHPGNQWRYRVHLTLSKLNQAKEFTSELREYIKENGRCA